MWTRRGCWSLRSTNAAGEPIGQQTAISGVLANLPFLRQCRSARRDLPTPGRPVIELKEPSPSARARLSDDGKNEQQREVALDQDTISQLHDALTREMREQLLDAFDAQQETCMRELDGAIERGDRCEIRRVSHMLKGSSASLGATRLRACLEGLERVTTREDAGVDESQLEELRVVAAATRRALRQQLT
jgi:HPt (histidine-containing phosphotransfer) domain-containing protein